MVGTAVILSIIVGEGRSFMDRAVAISIAERFLVVYDAVKDAAQILKEAQGLEQDIIRFRRQHDDVLSAYQVEAEKLSTLKAEYEEKDRKLKYEYQKKYESLAVSYELHAKSLDEELNEMDKKMDDETARYERGKQEYRVDILALTEERVAEETRLANAKKAHENFLKSIGAK